MQPGDPIWIFHGVEIVKRITVADIADSLAAIIAILAFLLGVRRFSKTISDGTEAIRQGNAALQSNHYSELDHFYADILKIGIEKPHLRSPKPIASDEEAMFGDYRPYAPEKDDDGTMAEQYDAYAFLVWNFLETIHDRCHEDESLRGTWKPVIAAENRIHRGWFLAEMRNEYKRRSSAKDQASEAKFCPEFRAWIYQRRWNEKDWSYEAAAKCEAHIAQAFERKSHKAAFDQLSGALKPAPQPAD